MDQIRPAAGYFRVSVSRDGMMAPEIYTDETKRYCRFKDLALGEVFSDLDHSGFRGAKPRPGLAELVRRRLQFSAVIVPKLARFGRSVKDLVYLFERFRSRRHPARVPRHEPRHVDITGPASASHHGCDADRLCGFSMRSL